MWENKLINKNTNNKIKKILVGNKANLLKEEKFRIKKDWIKKMN